MPDRAADILARAQRRSLEVRVAKSAEKRDLYLELIRTHLHTEALAVVGITDNTYRYWRRQYPSFAAQVDAQRARQRAETGIVERGAHIGFAEARLKFFGTTSPAAQLIVIQALMEMVPGQMLMVLFHPLAGKTQLFEDFANWMYGWMPAWRSVIGMNKKDHAEQVLGKVRDRMEPFGGYDEYLAWGGPFREIGSGKRHQKWTDDAFNIARKPFGGERDVSMRAVGIKSSVASIRTDHLHGDDLQDKETKDQTERIEGKVRQDWLSRPAHQGKASLFGNRVDDDDIYERLSEDEGLVLARRNRPPILKVIKLPAIVRDERTGEERPLMPWFTMDALEDMEAKVGPEAWARNWLQRPELVGRNVHFTYETLNACKDSQRRLMPYPGQLVWMGLDPGIRPGITMITSWDVSTGNLICTGLRREEDIRTNESMMVALEEEIVRHELAGARVAKVFIEDTSYSKGLGRDERLLKLCELHKIEALPHVTGANKWDANIGVLSMAHTFVRREFVLPYHVDDPVGRQRVDDYIMEFRRWRPLTGPAGRAQVQDRVMSTWFVWINWQLQLKVPVDTDDSAWQRQPLGSGIMGANWERTERNLIVPIGASR